MRKVAAAMHSNGAADNNHLCRNSLLLLLHSPYNNNCAAPWQAAAPAIIKPLSWMK